MPQRPPAGEVFGVERFLDLAGRVLTRGGPALDDVLAAIG